MQKITFLFIIFFYSISFLQAQIYTQAQYEVDITTDVIYGTAENFAGTEEILLMDIYKPKNDLNCEKPVMIFVHGGAWVTDSKENESMVYMSTELAKRGWVVANINYRLGTNKAEEYEANLFCTNFTEPCAFNSDTLEMERANFRAMQDAKGAIRFMKSRNAIDSTDINNVFMAGESAGGFISLSAGFTMTEEKKPASCFEVNDVPTPDADLAALDCYDGANDLSRPDLGSIEGTLHLGEYNSKLAGVGSFFGGVVDLSVFSTTNAPSVYLFSQGSDVIIHYDYGIMFERISNECFNGICQSYGPYPYAYGGEGIRKYFESIGAAAPNYQAEIIYNFEAGNNCIANGHVIDNAELRMQNMVNFFALTIQESGNNPAINCTTINTSNLDFPIAVQLLENPVHDHIQIVLPENNLGITFSISDLTGKMLKNGILNDMNSTIAVDQFSNGMYLLHLQYEGKTQAFKIIKN